MPIAVNAHSRVGRLLQIYEHVDGVVAAHFARVGADHRPPCAAGCAHCCGHVFFWTSLELFTGLFAYGGLHPGEFAKLTYQADKLAQKVLRKHPSVLPQVRGWLEYGQIPSPEDLAEHETRWKTVGELPCLFLLHGRCSIYPHRPLVCRTYGWTRVFLPKTQQLLTPNCPPFAADPRAGDTLVFLPEYDSLRERIEVMSAAIATSILPLVAWFYGCAEIRAGVWPEKHHRLACVEEWPREAASPLRATAF